MITLRFLNSRPEWDIYASNCTTIGKTPRKEWSPTPIWMANTIRSGHSTLDKVYIEVYDDAIQSDVCSQIVRHKTYGTTHSVQSKRPDWTGEERPKDPKALRMYRGTFTIRAFLKMMRERLCYTAMEDTRIWANKVYKEMEYHEDVFMRAIGTFCVPECVYQGGCPMGDKCCGLMSNKTLKDRYAVYNHERSFNV